MFCPFSLAAYQNASEEEERLDAIGGLGGSVSQVTQYTTYTYSSLSPAVFSLYFIPIIMNFSICLQCSKRFYEIFLVCITPGPL